MDDKFETKKSLGQHFLNSPVVPGWLTDAADIKPGDLVIEFGPGTGALTEELLKREARVIALEADKRAIEELEDRFDVQLASGQLHIKHYDLRNLDLSSLEEITDHKFKIVANIPYYLSGHLFRNCLQSSVQPSDLVFLVQKEVAKRICVDQARGEKESLLSLSVKAYGKPTYIRTVTRGHFAPPPKVDSAIIKIATVDRNNFELIDENKFFEILHLGFGQKRKQLLGNLSKTFPREDLINAFSTANIPLSTRAEDVTTEKWLELVKLLCIH